MDFEDFEKKSNMERTTGQIQTSVLISREFYDLCKNNGIKFTEALRVGISLMLAEKGVSEYDNRLNVYRRMMFFKLELEKISQQFEELKNKSEQKDFNDQIKKEADAEFKKMGI